MEETTLHIYRTSGGNVFLSFWGSDVELYLGSADTPEAKDGECYTINPYTLKIEPRSKEVILPKTSEQIFTGDLQQRIAELERERDGLKKRVAELEAERASTAEPKTWEKKALKEYIEKFGPKQTSEPPAMPKCEKCGESLGTWSPVCPKCNQPEPPAPIITGPGEYKTRDGKKITILRQDENEKFPHLRGFWFGIFEIDDSVWEWPPNGQFTATAKQHKYDIIGPWVEPEPPAPLNSTTGKCDKCGEFIGTWAPTCPTCAASPDTSRAALVAEARKLFAVLPLWVHWIAKDKDERWWAFSYEPSSSTDCEHTGGGRAFSLRNATYPAPTWRGDWRESKISRKECE